MATERTQKRLDDWNCGFSGAFKRLEPRVLYINRFGNLIAKNRYTVPPDSHGLYNIN